MPSSVARVASSSTTRSSTIKQWDVIRVAPNVARGFEAGPEGLEIIAAGGSKPEGGDGELVEGHWPGD